MEYILRDIEKLLNEYLNEFRALAIVGPRQSGKTTLVKKSFSHLPYVSLEKSENLDYAENDTNGFLALFPDGAVIDEAQRSPKIFNYLQQILDEYKPGQKAKFILTGSNNFLLQQNISQSLAGRIGYLDLLPLSFHEISKFGEGALNLSTNSLILKGGYPEIYQEKRTASIWYSSYIRTYVERDVKMISRITETTTFSRFLRFCAGRVGQQLNISALSIECGIDVITVKRWLSILEQSFIIFLLPPYHKNFNKRLVKTPKLYFYDSGLAAWLLSIYKEEEMAVSHFKGALFENLVITEFLKTKFNLKPQMKFSYWRDNSGLEIDLIIEEGNSIIPVEIKATQTFSTRLLESIHKWNLISGGKGGKLIYEGQADFTEREGITIENWRILQNEF